MPSAYASNSIGYVTCKSAYTMEILYLTPVSDEEMYDITPEMKVIIETLKKTLGNKFPHLNSVKYKGWAKITLEQPTYLSTMAGLVYEIELYNFEAEVPIEANLELENGTSFHFDVLSDEKIIRYKLRDRNPDFKPGYYETYQGYNTISMYVVPIGGKCHIEKNKVIINDEKENGIEEERVYTKITGELYIVETKKDTLGKRIKVKKLIKTDKYTQREIVIPDIGEIVVNTNSECKFEEDRLLEQTLGEIYSKIKPGADYKVRMPQAGCAPRGTQFITKIEKDGTTTLTVLEGEVEFSDIQKRKTILVRKNQKSVVNPGGLPSEPVYINPKMIPRWWQ